MTKKFLSLALTLVICLGLTVPALASSEGPNVEGADAIIAEYDYQEVNYPLELYQSDCEYGVFFLDDKGWQRTVDGVCKIERGTPITISNIGTDMTAYTYIMLQRYTYCIESKLVAVFDEEYTEVAPINIMGAYYGTNTPVALVNSVPSMDKRIQTASAGSNLSWVWYEDGPADWTWVREDLDSVKLYPGESVTFTLPDEGTDTIYRLIYVMYYPEYSNWKFYGWDYLKYDGNFGVIQPKPFAPPTIQAAPIAAAPTASTVLVNGEKKAFDAYNIEGNNYFKLRDLAYVLSGTDKRFEVSWDAAANAISLTSGKAYTTVGGEMAAQENPVQSDAVLSASKILLDGKEISLTAYTINGNNYFKLRDLGQTFDFGVGWNGEAQTISIDTSTGYTAG